MELSVGFADKDDSRDFSDYTLDKTVLGKVYIPKENVGITGPIGIRYERHPWLERFELDGIVALRPKRSGFGTKGAKGFVQSLNSIYAKAYEDYAKFCEPTAKAYEDYAGKPDSACNPGEWFDTTGYFAHVTDCFVGRYRADGNTKMLRKYCGFVENMWREGNKEMCEVALCTIVPMLQASRDVSDVFVATITEEFQSYLHGANLM